MTAAEFSTDTEREALCGFLDLQRAVLIRKVQGITDADARTSPTVASPSSIRCRIFSAEDQKVADSGLPAASMPRLIPGRDPRASSAGTASRARATSRLVSPASERAASSAI